MKNDKNLINKIISTLSGYTFNTKKNCLLTNEIFKIEKSEKNDYIFKILIELQSKVSICIFNCIINKIYLEQDLDYLIEISKYFKQKQKLSNSFSERINNKIKKNEESIIKFHNINKRFEEQENYLLHNVQYIIH